MPIHTINAQTLKGWLDAGEAVLIDVREPAEYASEHIQAATLIPLSVVSERSIPNLTNKKLVIHCKSGKRGGMACEKLLTENPSLDIYNLEGGISAWAQAGYTVKSSGKFFLPLDRQVQLTIGVGVFTCTLLGYLVNPKFLILSGFFGLGVTFAGLTGTCGLAILLAKMPWNQKGAQPSSCCAAK